jgi:regulator of sirC expression with transglutaminase-like and TPR domain
MKTSYLLPDWNTLATCGDDELPLLDTALLIARDEYPELDPNDYIEQIRRFANDLQPHISDEHDLPSQLTAINKYLFDEQGFTGNHTHYNDPRNSYLNEVFDRKLGIPISLAVVQIELMRRLGLALDGISFPGHFLVRLPVDDGILVMDPFNKGRPVSVEELKERATPHMNGHPPDDQELYQILAPATHRMILSRMLRNLKGLYVEAGDWERVARSADRLLKISHDSNDAFRDRGLAYRELGHLKGAREDLSRYLQLTPHAEDDEAIRNILIELSSNRWQLN